MLEILTAIIPIFLVILMGYILRITRFPGDDFWIPAEKIIYFIFIPCLFFDLTANANLAEVPLLSTPMVFTLAIIILSALLLLFKPAFAISNPAFTSVFQGAVRFNSYVGISAAAALYGLVGKTITAITVAVSVPVINVLCVLVLLKFGTNPNVKWRVVLSRIVTNPLILSCIIGFVFNLLGIKLPFIFGETIRVISEASLPLGLLAVGAGLNLQALEGASRALFISSFAKLLLLPLLVGALCIALNLPAEILEISVIFAALPSATSSYILAKQMGGDTHLMSGIVVLQTLLAAITMPLVLILARALY